jgi:hypothetical protein
MDYKKEENTKEHKKELKDKKTERKTIWFDKRSIGQSQ